MFGKHYPEHSTGERVFSVDPRPVQFGEGACRELGYEAQRLGMSCAALICDAVSHALPATGLALESLHKAGIRCQIYSLSLIHI